MGSPRHQGPGRDRRHGLHAASASTGTRAPTTCSSTPPTRRSRRPGVDKDDVDAYWLGTAQGGMSGITLARPLQLDDKPVTRVENFCATGSEALRKAALRGGVRRVRHRDGGRRREGEGLRLPGPQRAAPSRTTAPAARSPRRRCSRWSRPPTPTKYGVDDDELRGVLARIAWKNHYNGARNPRAQFRKEVSMETICAIAAGGRRRSASSTAPAWPTARPPRSSCGPRTPPVHRQAALREGAVVRGRQRRAASSTRRTTTRRSPRSWRRAERRLRAGRHHRPARRARAWPRCTTASPRPSWC